MTATRLNSKKSVLYNDGTGTNGTVTLSQSAADFEFMRIYFRSNDSFYNSVDLYKPNGKIALLISGWLDNNVASPEIKMRAVTVSGTSISTSSTLGATSNAYADIVFSTGVKKYFRNQIFITRVEAWN